jgi:hypothetical protein
MNSLKQDITQLYGIFSRVNSQVDADWTRTMYNNIHWETEFQYLTSTIAPAAPAPAAPAPEPAAPAPEPAAPAPEPAAPAPERPE